jgi:hypothetical protein
MDIPEGYTIVYQKVIGDAYRLLFLEPEGGGTAIVVAVALNGGNNEEAVARFEDDLTELTRRGTISLRDYMQEEEAGDV